MDSYRWITEYIEYLNSEYGLAVAIRDFCGFMSKNSDVANSLLAYCLHTSPFCLCVKEDITMQNRCTSQGRYLMAKCRRHDSPFVTICYCGYCDLVIPVKFRGDVVAAVCIGGFETSPDISLRRISKQAKRYGRDEEEMKKEFFNSITSSTSLSTVQKTCSVIADFLLMYYTMLHSSGLVNEVPKYMHEPATLYLISNIDHFIHTNYFKDIHIEDIADYCKCSKSYISHIFKSNMNRSIPTYINEIRISQAKRMLMENGNITAISEACGFSSPCYFSAVFSRYVGVSPTQYRQGAFNAQLPDGK